MSTSKRERRAEIVGWVLAIGGFGSAIILIAWQAFKVFGPLL
ncbi:hypothetical protein JXVLWARM_CDS_0106 [Burkholderia phage Bm1]